jgi:hypothetical protein
MCADQASECLHDFILLASKLQSASLNYLVKAKHCKMFEKERQDVVVSDRGAGSDLGATVPGIHTL